MCTKCLRALLCACLMLCCWGMQAYIGFRSSIWSFNQVVAAWEPVMEPWDIILKMDANPSPLVSAVFELTTALWEYKCSKDSWLLNVLIAIINSAHGRTVRRHLRCCNGQAASPAYLCKLVWVQAAFGVQPGTHLTVKSTSEALHLTLAYAAVSSVVAAIQEWRDLRGAQVCHTPHVQCLQHLSKQVCDSMCRLSS